MLPYRLGRFGRLGAGCAALWVLGAVAAPAHAQPAGAQPAGAQPECAPDARIQTAGEERTNSQPVFMGLTASGDLMEVRSTSDGSWTIVLTLKDGSSCAVIGGEFWETVVSTANGLDDRHRSP